MSKNQHQRQARFVIDRMVATAALCLALSTVVPAAAQNGPAAPTRATTPAPPEDIVVVGRKDQDKQIRDFVRGMTPALGNEALARWDAEKSCPMTIGLKPEDNQAITERLRRVAPAAKIGLAPADCHNPNVLVIFAPDKEAVLTQLRRQTPGMFRDVYGDPITLPKDDSPAVAWHVDALVSRDGARLSNAGGGPYVLRSTINPSRIQAMVRPVYILSIVVIQLRGAVGLTRTQLADYAALRAFTDASPAQAAKMGAPSILTVLDAPMDSATPLSMTTWDFTFLKGLYAAPAALFSSAQRGAIGTYMRRGLSGETGAKR